uniref:Uncharacterized protein n=1 Tax=Meloidogyne enterolobii TaxID=390850 RepID=A0A6V7XBB5_MELEN|nr:unnamed protein product [Meloidogyne enterolobii]
MLKETNGEIDLKETETQSPPPTTTNTKTSTNNTTTQAEIDESLQVHQQQPVNTLPTTPIVIEKTITTTKITKKILLKQYKFLHLLQQQLPPTN